MEEDEVPEGDVCVVEQSCNLMMVVVTQIYTCKESSKLGTHLVPMSVSGYCTLITEAVIIGRHSSTSL